LPFGLLAAGCGLVWQLTGRLGVANAAGAIEAAARLDHQFAHRDVAGDPAAGENFQALGRNTALEAAADHDPLGLDFALDPPVLADHDLGAGTDRALDPAVDMQVVAQGEVADKL